MGRFEELDTCAELSADHAREAAASSATMRAFLSWAEHMARPDEGAPKILLAIAQLASASWVDGALYVDITGDDSVTKLSIFIDFGFEIRERLLPLCRLPVPFDEFVRAVRLAPKLIAPFKGQQLGGSLVLTPPDATIDDGIVAIAEANMTEDPSKTAPPPPVVTVVPPSIPEKSGVHTHPTVRRMVAVRPEALRSGNDD